MKLLVKQIAVRLIGQKCKSLFAIKLNSAVCVSGIKPH